MKKVIAFITLVIILTSVSVFAVDTWGGYNVPVDIDINGSFIKCVEKPILVDSTTYIPLRAFSDAIGGEIGWNDAEKAATMTKSGHTFVFYTGKGYCMIDGVKKNHHSLIYKDLTFIPVRAVSETLNYRVKWDDYYLTVKITASGVRVPESCKDKTYTYEDINYLAKITHVESGSQHFKVKLGVAGVVVNRMKSSEFPNTIKGVIYDTNYGVQFPPAHNGKIDTTPSKESIIAAKCVLNGVNVVGNSLYFNDAAYAESSWAHHNRPHFGNIYDMAFYE